MRLPRWAMVTLLLATTVTVLGSGIGWWATWPERTAREFLNLVAAQNYDEAALRFQWKPKWENQTFVLFRREPGVIEADFQPDRQSLSEFVRGRRQFRYGRSLIYRFTVERGKIIESDYQR